MFSSAAACLQRLDAVGQRVAGRDAGAQADHALAVEAVDAAGAVGRWSCARGWRAARCSPSLRGTIELRSMARSSFRVALVRRSCTS